MLTRVVVSPAPAILRRQRVQTQDRESVVSGAVRRSKRNEAAGVHRDAQRLERVLRYGERDVDVYS